MHVSSTQLTQKTHERKILNYNQKIEKQNFVVVGFEFQKSYFSSKKKKEKEKPATCLLNKYPAII